MRRYIKRMSVHLLKPALRIQDVFEFAQRQHHRKIPRGRDFVYPVWTSRKPQRADDLINGGSVYWIVKNAIQCRQEVLDIEEIQEEGEDKPSFLILCKPQLIRTLAVARRPFQGWRYLEAGSAPPDIGLVDMNEAGNAPPAEMATQLRAAGLL